MSAHSPEVLLDHTYARQGRTRIESPYPIKQMGTFIDFPIEKNTSTSLQRIILDHGKYTVYFFPGPHNDFFWGAQIKNYTAKESNPNTEGDATVQYVFEDQWQPVHRLKNKITPWRLHHKGPDFGTVAYVADMSYVELIITYPRIHIGLRVEPGENCDVEMQVQERTYQMRVKDFSDPSFFHPAARADILFPLLKQQFTISPSSPVLPIASEENHLCTCTFLTPKVI